MCSCTLSSLLAQAVFQLDSSSYHGHVFAGLSSLQLGSAQEARHHYQTAVALQPGEGLAWKVGLHVCVCVHAYIIVH